MNFAEEIIDSADTVRENGATSDDLFEAVKSIEEMAKELKEAEDSNFRTDYSREELIAICERAIVPMSKWANRDSPGAQEGIGRTWQLLKAGVDFCIETSGICATDKNTIWLEFDGILSFNSFEYGRGEDYETGYRAYLPTPARLDSREGRDWY